MGVLRGCAVADGVGPETRRWENNSVSRKKVLCHEEIYATFDATKGTTPIADIEAFKMDLDSVRGEVEGLSLIHI